nr:beta-propeller domain-containing protein [Thermoleophilaceae bacterium]
ALVSSRLNGETARGVVSSPARGLAEPDLRPRLAGWVPRTTLVRHRTGRRTTRRLTSCRDVRRSTAYAGVDMLTVLTIDMSKGLPAVDSDALMTSAEIAYASPASLYVAAQRWEPEPDSPSDRPPDTRTDVHKFDISAPGRTEYRGSGVVPGYLLNQFSLSEHRGVLRAATTETPLWWGGRPAAESQSFVTTLDERAGRLAELGRVEGLGRGERIYAVRFVEDIGFVVTFRQTDPLYTVDLADPRRPRVLGELKIRGYSAYLHPLGGDLLLGVGQDATEEGARLGTQLSLFDVSDLRRPTRLQQRSVGSGSSSQVEYDHHAFLWWAPSELAVLPVQEYGDSEQFVGAIGFGVDRAGIGERGRAAHQADGYAAPILRSFVVGGRLFTLSDVGLEANTLSTLAEEGSLKFPAPLANGTG